MLPIKQRTSISIHTAHHVNAQQQQIYPGTHQMKRLQSCRKYNSSKAGDCVAVLRIACRRHMLLNKHELHTTSAPHTHRTSCQRPTKQNQKYPGTHQIKLRQCCRKYNSSKAGDFVPLLPPHADVTCYRSNTNFTQHPHRSRTAHHVNAQRHKIKNTLELTKRSVFNPAGNTAPARLVIWL